MTRSQASKALLQSARDQLLEACEQAETVLDPKPLLAFDPIIGAIDPAAARGEEPAPPPPLDGCEYCATRSSPRVVELAKHLKAQLSAARGEPTEEGFAVGQVWTAKSKTDQRSVRIVTIESHRLGVRNEATDRLSYWHRSIFKTHWQASAALHEAPPAHGATPAQLTAWARRLIVAMAENVRGPRHDVIDPHEVDVVIKEMQLAAGQPVNTQRYTSDINQ